MPWLVGVLTALVVWYVWGSLAELPIWHDESAYLFQATIFAHGRWSAPAPPLPEFFEQAYVLVSPTYAAKYPPGNSLALVPGVWLGLPGLVPVVLAGVSGGLVHALARRLAGGWVALLTWLVWLGTPDNLRFHASYFSEVVTGTLWLGGWWALARWRETGRLAWLVTVALAVGWGAITRPVTTVAYVIPVAVVIALECRRRARWTQLAPAAAAGLLVLGIVPLWSAETTGDWRVTPLDAYTRDYLPWDYPGFGIVAPAPRRPLPPDMAAFDRSFRALHAQHTLDRAPLVLAQRGFLVGYNTWRGWRLALVPFALVGVAALSGAGALGVATALLLLLAYVTYAHFPSWTVYYLEVQPVLAFVTACGLVRVASRLPARAAGAGLAAAAAVLIADTGMAAPHWRGLLAGTHAHQRAFAAAVAHGVSGQSIVFVRYAPDHDVYRSLIVNEPFLDRSAVWKVYDRGADNGRLLAMFPERTPYLYDEATGRLEALAPASGPHEALRTVRSATR